MRRFWRRLKNVLSWVQFLWDDDSFDWEPILRLWAEKLRRTRVHIAEHQNHTRWEEDCQTLGICEAALNRMAQDDYLADAWREHRERYPLRWGPGNSKVEPPTQEERNARAELIEREEAVRAADCRLFCDTFARHYRDWWD